MKNTDLRVGNWVDTVYNVPYIKITEIKNYIVCGKNCKGISYPSLKPIALTEEILLKCGFECVKQSEGNYFSLAINSNGDYLASNPDGFFFVLNNEDNFEDEYLPELSIKLDIHCLHQLQNLYHTLTGQELKIEL